MTDFIEIFVKLPTGRPIQLEIEPKATCDSLQSLIAPRLLETNPAITLDHFVLSFSGKVLAAAKRLSDYNIQYDSTVHVLVKQPPQDIFNFDRCDICGFQALDPCVLPCGHSCCQSCIEGETTCPRCQTSWSEAAPLPSNWAASQFMDPKPKRSKDAPKLTDLCMKHGLPQDHLDVVGYPDASRSLLHHETEVKSELSSILSNMGKSADNRQTKLDQRKKQNLAEMERLENENRSIDAEIQGINENKTRRQASALFLSKEIDEFPSEDVLDFEKLEIIRKRVNQTVFRLKPKTSARIVKHKFFYVEEKIYEQLLELLLENRSQTLVLVKERFTADRLKDELSKDLGVWVDRIHGHMTMNTRDIVGRFAQNQLRILIGTKALERYFRDGALGPLGQIIHYDVPKLAKEYDFWCSESLIGTSHQEFFSISFQNASWDFPPSLNRIIELVEAGGDQIPEKIRYEIKRKMPTITWFDFLQACDQRNKVI